MEIYTLVGRSGTGKSYHAMDICRRYHIDSIIDDGLFIYQNTIVAGMSAKRDATRIGAVKTALFLDDEIRKQVADAIREKAPDAILILGTSDEMTDNIMEQLGIDTDPEKIHRLRIEEITTPEEMEIARQQRDKQGKHVIPAPALQLKRNFAGYVVDPLRILREKDAGAAAERTVVRPAYSYMGDYVVAESVLEDIAFYVADAMPSIGSVIRVVQDPRPESFKMMVSVRVNRGWPILESAEAFQKRMAEMVEQMTAFNVTAVHVEVRAIGNR